MAKRYLLWKPPLVPSKKRLKTFARILKAIRKKSGNKALLLGATPSLRDLLAEMKFDVTLIDFSPNMIFAMTKLRKTESKERKIVGNWLEASRIIEDKFDVIIGDVVTNNLVSIKNYPKFFYEMEKLLKPQGELILCVVGNFKNKKMSIDKMVQIAKNFPDYYKVYENKMYDDIVCLFSDPKIYNQRTFLSNFFLPLIILKQKLKKGEINKKEFNLLRSIIHLPLKISCPPSKVFNKLASQYFKIIKIDWDKNCHPVYNYFHRVYRLKRKN